jgi:hypothetical protein
MPCNQEVRSLYHLKSISLPPATDNTTTVGISQSLLDNFQLFANFTAASYCPGNENSTSDSLITCTDNACPLVAADNVTSLVEFGGSYFPFSLQLNTA